MILVFSFLTYQRNAVWTDNETLWKDTVEKSPAKARPYVNLAYTYQLRKDYQKAAFYYLKALQQKETDKEYRALVFLNLGSIYGDMESYEMSAFCFRKVIALTPYVSEAYVNLTLVYLLLGDDEKALACGKVAFQAAPEFSQWLMRQGALRLLNKEYAKAIKIFKFALKLEPANQAAKKELQTAQGFLKAVGLSNGGTSGK